ncbi:hypothetical protein BY458DRAFT_494436 [Sporodiniella umbellata]|nr:hypothetical protein BY458DRAFT_494436 [Sporodiniella umbellata]
MIDLHAVENRNKKSNPSLRQTNYGTAGAQSITSGGTFNIQKNKEREGDEDEDDFNNSSKIDGLALKRNSISITVAIELTRGSHTNTERKLESDSFKIYNSISKTLKKKNKQKAYAVLYRVK